jgi:hypothetical protein
MTENKELLQAVNKLSDVVRLLDATMKRDYPKRVELQNYLSKREGRKRIQYFAAAAVVATLLSFFVTVSSVNYCFLNGVPEPGERDICQVFPGWEESFDNNRRFTDLINNNQQRLDELERKVGNGS